MATANPAITFINNLPAYNTSEEAFSKFDLIRQVVASRMYYQRTYAFPTDDNVIPGTQNNIAARSTVEDTIIVEPYSIVLAIGCYSTRVEGFKFQINDVGTGQEIGYRTFMNSKNFGSMISGVPGATLPQNRGINLDEPVGLTFLKEPFIILAPARLTIQIVNMAPVDTFLQLAIDIAIPTTRNSLGQLSNQINGIKAA